MCKKIIFISFLLASCIILNAQDTTLLDSVGPFIEVPVEVEDSEQPTFSLASPRATISSHLIYLQQSNYQPDLSAQALYPGDLSPARLKTIARMLIQIYDGAGYFIDPDEIPKNETFVDSAGRNRFVVFDQYPQIYVQKYGDQWLYSRRTVQAIPAIHKEIYPYGADLLVHLVPASIGNKSFLGLKVWQYVGILLLLLGAFVLYYVVDKLLSWVLKRIVKLISAQLDMSMKDVHPVAKPLSWLLVTLVIAKFVPILQFDIALSQYVTSGLRILSSLFGIMVAYRLIELAAKIAALMASRTDTTMDDQLIPLLTRIVKIIVVTFGLIFILQNLGVNVTALLAGVSIGGLALALAAQDTVKNFIGSLSIFLDRPFQIGDYIESGSMAGVVEEVGVRSTRLRELGGSLVSIPNGTLVNMTITNHGLRSHRRLSTSLTVTYATSRAQMEAFVDAVREIVESRPDVTPGKTVVQFNQMSSSSLDVVLTTIFTKPDYDLYMIACQEIYLGIMDKAQEMGVEFAFPSTSLYVEQMPGKD